MIFTVVVDADTKQDAAQPYEVREEIVRLLAATQRGWLFKVWPATKTEADT